MSPLAALALAGQSLRLAHPPVPPEAADGWHLPDDPVPPLPDHLRGLLLRVVTQIQGPAGPALYAPLMAHIAASSHRLHPFDYHRMAGLLATAALRPAEQAWRDRTLLPALTPATWTNAATWRRVRFLTALREHDPDLARQLLEAAYPIEPAAIRADLLLALGTGLGIADRPFLLMASQDSAMSVQKAAQELLDRVPGSAALAARVRTAASRFQVQRTGPGRLAYKPAGPGVTPLQTLDGFGLADLAAALATEPEALAAMDADDPVRLALAACALRDGAVHQAELILDRMQDFAWPADLTHLGTAFTRLPDRHGFAGRVLRGDIGGDWRPLCLALGRRWMR